MEKFDEAELDTVSVESDNNQDSTPDVVPAPAEPIPDDTLARSVVENKKS